jgi:hypothetical protein
MAKDQEIARARLALHVGDYDAAAFDWGLANHHPDHPTQAEIKAFLEEHPVWYLPLPHWKKERKQTTEARRWVFHGWLMERRKRRDADGA